VLDYIHIYIYIYVYIIDINTSTITIVSEPVIVITFLFILPCGDGHLSCWNMLGGSIVNKTTCKYYCTFVGIRDRGSTVVKVLCYKSEGRWFDPSWCQWIFH